VPYDPIELASAISHEVRNHLTSVRLQADALALDSDPEALPTAVERFHVLTEQSGALLGQLGALLEGPERGRSDPGDAIDALHGVLPERFDTRVRFELKSALQAPAVAIGPRLLHALLVTALIGAFEAAPPGAAVAVSAAQAGARVVFSVSASVRPEVEAARQGGALAGRRVEVVCAEAILSRLGGGAECRFANGRRSVLLEVPVVA
jgi:C4-dicarboxylate-specific signal transduction histidine kinase